VTPGFDDVLNGVEIRRYAVWRFVTVWDRVNVFKHLVAFGERMKTFQHL
jgi:hypothetical protein